MAQFLRELGLGGGGGLVFIEELAAVALAGGGLGIGDLGLRIRGACHECLRCGFSMRAWRLGAPGGGCCWLGGED